MTKAKAELTRLGHVTRARITQIMNLLHLAPDIQEVLLFLPRVERGHDPIQERQLRPIAAIADWRKQRKLWRHVQAEFMRVHVRAALHVEFPCDQDHCTLC